MMASNRDGERGAVPMKLIIVGVVALLLLGGGGFFGFKFWKAKKAAAAAAAAVAAGKEPGKEGDAKAGEGAPTDPHAKPAGDEDEDEAGAEGGGHGGGAGSPAVMTYRNIVNLEGPRRNAFLKVELHILFRDPDLGKAATSDKPTPEKSQIQALLLEMLSGKNLEEVSDLETRQSIRMEIKEKLNEKFKHKPKHGEKEDPKAKKPKKPVKDVLVVDWAIQQ